MDISFQLNSSTEAFFQELEKNKKALQDSWAYITETLNTALLQQDVETLLSLIPYMEQGEGTLAYAHIGESRRVLRILHIIQLELTYKKTPFFLHCTNKNSLMEKYMLSLFALRRLAFQLAEDSVKEAQNYLSTSRLSVFAIYIILQEDLICPTQALYDSILSLCSAYWNAADKELFLSLTAGR